MPKSSKILSLAIALILISVDDLPHIPVFDKCARKDGTFSRDDFTYDEENDRYICPDGKDLKRYRVAGRRAKAGNVPKDGTYRYRALNADCDACALKPKCCPKLPMRKVPRSIFEPARDVAGNLRGTPDDEFIPHERKKVEMSCRPSQDHYKT